MVGSSEFCVWVRLYVARKFGPSIISATQLLATFVGAPLTTLAATLSSSNPAHKLTALELVEANVRAQVANVVNSDVVQAAWSEDEDTRGRAKLVAVHGWVYDIEHGRVRDLGVSVYN